MKLDQQQQAQHLYFQTDLSKSEIANMLGVSRSTLHYWIHQNNWEILKKNADYMPTCLAENCYRILGHLSDSLLSEERNGKPATPQEINSMYKLTITINKLKTRSTLNESMELLKFFTESIEKEDQVLAEMIQPNINKYISSRAAQKPTRYMSEKFNGKGYIPKKEQLDAEAKLDDADLMEWAELFKTMQDKEQSPATNKNTDPAQTTATNDVATPCPNNVESEVVSTSHIAPNGSIGKDEDARDGKLAPIPHGNIEHAQTSVQSVEDGVPPISFTQNNRPKQKTDLRKLLRGSATSGPCKSLRQNTAAAA